MTFVNNDFYSESEPESAAEANAEATAPPPEPFPKFLMPAHQKQLEAIEQIVRRNRGYFTATSAQELEEMGHPTGKLAQRLPGLAIPIYDASGKVAFYQVRFDSPRYTPEGKAIKYETPRGARMVLDIHPDIRKDIGNPGIPLYITEGIKKADAAISRGLCCTALLGVWNWRTSNDVGGTTVSPDWEYFALKGRKVYVVFDSDVMKKEGVKKALERLCRFLVSRGATVTVIYLPEGKDGSKVGLDDYFLAGGTAETLQQLALKSEENNNFAPEPEPPSPEEIRTSFQEQVAQLGPPATLEEVKATFRKYLYIENDSLLEILLCVIAGNLMDGDPIWIMLVGPSSGGKTEFLNAFRSLPFVREAATLTEASLLSGTSKKEQSKNATGGLLCQIGPFGFLYAKDFTSVLSMRKDASTGVLAALREVYDGAWTRLVGTDGGLELSWKGRLAMIACCTEIIDHHHATVGAMGERFVFFRLPRICADEMARRAISGSGNEDEMREELQKAVAGFFAGLDIPARPSDLSESEVDRLVALAKLAAKCRSAVQRDSHSRGISMVIASEYPGRIAKILKRVFAGLITVGIERDRAWQLVAKVAFDSMHKNRLLVMRYLLENSSTKVRVDEVSEALFVAVSTARRVLEDLTAHGVLEIDVDENPNGKGGRRDLWKLAGETHATIQRILGPDFGSALDTCFPPLPNRTATPEAGKVSPGHRKVVSERPPTQAESDDIAGVDRPEEDYVEEDRPLDREDDPDDRVHSAEQEESELHGSDGQPYNPDGSHLNLEDII